MPDRPETLLAQRAWLTALARQLVGRGDLAEELAQDALAAAVTSPLPQTAGPRAWLAAILRRQLAGRRRAEARQQARQVQAARPEAQPSASDAVLRFELQRAVADAVLALAEPYRTTVLLRFFDGLSPGAIASRQSVPVETVRTRLKRGLQMLRERLDRAHGGDRAAWAAPLLAGLGRASVTSSILTGVLLMHTGWKLLAVPAALAAVLLVVAAPWSPAGAPLPDAEGAVPPVAAAVASEGAAAAAAPAAGGNERIPATPAPASEAAWLEVTGTVVDDDTGLPLAAAAVQLIGLPAAEPGDDAGGVQSPTAADGRFTLRDTRPRQHNNRLLVVRATDRAPLRVHVPLDAERQSLQRVDLGTLRVAAGTLFSGRVLTAEGLPVRGAGLWVGLVSPGYSGFGPQNLLLAPCRVGTTRDDGCFTLTERILPNPDHQGLLFAVAEQGIGWGSFVPSKQRRSVDDLELRLRPNGAVRVRVVGADGAPVAGAAVTVLPRFGPLGIEQRDVREPVSRETSIAEHFAGATDRNGELLLLQLPIGERGPFREHGEEHDYDVEVRAEGHARQPLVPCRVERGATTEVTVRLVPRRGLTVDVAVRDDLGAPLPGAKVSVYGDGPIEGRTDAQGLLQVVVPVSDSLMVTAELDGHRDAYLQQTAIARDLRQQHVDLVLVRTLPLDGRVVDQTGAPLPDMWLFVDRSPFVRQRHLATTDRDGRFHIADFPAGLRPLLVALPPGADPARWPGKQEPKVVDAAAGPVTITVTRRPGAVDLRAAVVDATSGEPLELEECGVWLYLPEHDLLCLHARASHDHGVVTARGLPAARYRLDVRTISGQRGSREFELTEAQPPCELRLELPQPGTLVGHLRFVGVPAPATLEVAVQFAVVRRGMWTQFHYPGRWHADAQQQVVGDQNGQVGRLQLQPALGTVFQLDSVDPTEDIELVVVGDGITGKATVRVPPGGMREVTIDVRAKAK